MSANGGRSGAGIRLVSGYVPRANGVFGTDVLESAIGPADLFAFRKIEHSMILSICSLEGNEMRSCRTISPSRELFDPSHRRTEVSHIKFEITESWGIPVVHGKDWRILDIEDLESLIGKLQKMLEDAKELGSQDAVIAKGLMDYLRLTIRRSTWEFNTTKDQWSKDRGCVYFVRDPLNPSITKVGFTANLRQRTKSFKWQYADGDHDLDVIAIAYTPDYKRFENAMHQYLWRFHTQGEWFLSEGVDAAIKDIQKFIGK